MKVGFTGTQVGMTKAQRASVSFLFGQLEPVEEFHHGDCVGADAEAHTLANTFHLPVVIHPPSDNRKRAYCADYLEIRDPRPYMDRNLDIVQDTDVLIAVPKDTYEELRSGTWATLRRARKAGKPIFIVYPDGSIDRENTSS